MVEADLRRLHAQTTQTMAMGTALWQAGAARRARWLARAMATLRDGQTSLGATLRARLEGTSGLSTEMIAWALEACLGQFTEGALAALDARCTAAHPGLLRARPGQLAVVVLAGNVFSAAAHGLAIPLLFGWPVIAKVSSQEDALAPLLEIALSMADPALAGCLRVVSIDSDDAAGTGALFEHADAVSVYGSDQSLSAIRAQLRATVSFIPHGHGVGVALVGRRTLDTESRARHAAARLALDVAAYDQRGCLSPQVAWAIRGGHVPPRRFAELMFEALDALRLTLPRGTLTMAAASAQTNWRTQAAMRGTLLEGDGFSVAHSTGGSVRAGPCYRNVLLLELDDEAELPANVAPLSVHLKSLGVAGLDDRALLLASLPPRSAPRVCALGTMQRPPLAALADGLLPWDGLVRFIDG